MSDNMILDGQGPGEATKTTDGKSRKMRAGFATLAVLGLGAGLTTAAWTGDHPFTGSIDTADATSFQWRWLNHSGADPGQWNAPVLTSSEVAVSLPGTITLTPGAEVQTRYLQIKSAQGYDVSLDDVDFSVTSIPSGTRVTTGDATTFNTAFGSSAVEVPVSFTMPPGYANVEDGGQTGAVFTILAEFSQGQ